MNPDLFLEACEAAKFMIRHYPQAKDWIDPIGYCAWYISNGFMAFLRKDDGTIVAMAAARPVTCADDGQIPFKHAHDGQCIFIDFLAIEGEQAVALPGFAFLLQNRFGERREIAFTRQSVHSYDDFVRNIGRIKHRIGEPIEFAATTSVSP